MARTYLQLVNDAIIESGTDLDEISSGSFASTTDSMQRKWKRWVKQAWVDIQTERRNWHFMRKDGLYIAKPRLQFYDGNATVATVFDDAQITDTNDNWTHTVNGVVIVEEGAFASGTAKGYFAYKNTTDTYPIEEKVKASDLVQNPVYTFVFDEYTANPDAFPGPFVEGVSLYTTPTSVAPFGTVVSATEDEGVYSLTFVPAEGLTLSDVTDVLEAASNNIVSTADGDSPGGFLSDYQSVSTAQQTLRILGYGRYSFGEQSDAADSLLTDIQEIDLRSVKVSPYAGATDQDYSTIGYTPLCYVTYERWKQLRWDRVDRKLGRPSYFTIAPDGRYEFDCALDKEYVISFTYWKKPQELSLHDDEVEGISDFYTEAIVWKAVQYWADYDEQAGAANKALKRFTASYRKLLRDYSDEIKFPHGVGDASVR